VSTCLQWTGTPPISHAGHSDSFLSVSFSFLASGMPDWFKNQIGGDESGSDLEEQAIERKSQATQKKEWREILRDQRHHGRRQWNLKNGSAVPASKIMNHSSKQHVKEAAPDLTVSIGHRTATACHLDGGNRLAAKGALRQARRYLLAAIGAALRFPGRFSYGAHTVRALPLL